MGQQAEIIIIHEKDEADLSKRISIPQYPTGFSSDDNFTSVSFNTIDGTFNDMLICYKKKFTWKFDAISEDSLNTMYYGTAGIIGKIKEYKTRFFNITSNSTIPGMPSGLYYLGTPSSFQFIGQAGTGNNVTRQYSGELHWIQVYGTKLNQPIQDQQTEGGNG